MNLTIVLFSFTTVRLIPVSTENMVFVLGRERGRHIDGLTDTYINDAIYMDIVTLKENAGFYLCGPTL